jgi:chorismate mutase
MATNQTAQIPTVHAAATAATASEAAAPTASAAGNEAACATATAASTVTSASKPSASGDVAKISAAADSPDAGNAAPAGVLRGRERIDALDEQIAGLIRQRIEVSRAIQAARIAKGGRGVDLRRETEIIGRYKGALGRPGTAIAMALLELGRGKP